jgi:hypothetical protein
MVDVLLFAFVYLVFRYEALKVPTALDQQVFFPSSERKRLLALLSLAFFSLVSSLFSLRLPLFCCCWQTLEKSGRC